jgi:5'-nucleotidase
VRITRVSRFAEGKLLMKPWSWIARRAALAASLAAVLAACSTPSSAPSAPVAKTPVAVRLLAFNDFHGNLEKTSLSLNLPDPADPTKTVRVATGGAAFLAGKLAELKTGNPNTVILSSGDMIGGSPLVSAFFRDEPTIEIMNAMGVDFNAVGNHEFDKGVGELARIVKGGCNTDTRDPNLASCARANAGPYAGAKFAFLAANVVDAAGKPIYPPYIVREFQGAKIGFIGAVTRTTPTIVVPEGVRGVRFLDEAATINRYADELKAQGVNAIVASIHEGGVVESASWNDPACPNPRGEIFEIVGKLSNDVDAVFSAHTHQGYNCLVKGIPVIQAFSAGRGISQVDVVIDPVTRDIDRSKTKALNIPVVNDGNPPEIAAKFPAATPNAAVAKIVADYAALAAPKANREIGRITATINREPAPGGDFPAGRLIADAQLAATAAPDKGGAQIAFMNAGGIRSDFNCTPAAGAASCPVSFGAAFTVQPFGNSLVVMTLTGAQLKDLLEQQATGANAQRARMLQHSKGFTYTWTPTAAPGARVSNMRLNGTPIDPAKPYRITVNSFMADGGDGYNLLKTGKDRVGGAQDIDALIAYFAANNPVAPDLVGRIVVGN